MSYLGQMDRNRVVGDGHLRGGIETPWRGSDDLDASDPTRSAVVFLGVPWEEWEKRLAAIREKVHEETYRHLRALAELAAEEKRIEAEMAAERRMDRLQSRHSARTVFTKMQSAAPKNLPEPPGTGTSGRRTKSDHPFALALLASGTRISEWAAGHGVGEGQVKSWIKPPTIVQDGRTVRNPHVRQIPRVFADLIELEFDLPATERTWKQGIRDKA